MGERRQQLVYDEASVPHDDPDGGIVDTEHCKNGESTSRQHIIMVFLADGTIL